MSPTTPKRTRPSLAWCAVIFCFLFANSFSEQWILEHRSAAWWLTGSLAAAALLVYSLWRGERDFMASQDELEQKIRTEALARSFPCAIAVVLLLGKLHAAGFDLPAPWSRLIWGLPLLPYSVILVWCRRRYR